MNPWEPVHRAPARPRRAQLGRAAAHPLGRPGGRGRPTAGRCGSSPPPCAARWRATPPTPRASSAPAAAARPRPWPRTGSTDRPAAAVPPGQVGRTLFALRAPLRLAPGAAVTLRYAYGAAQPRAIPAARARAGARRAGRSSAASGAGPAGCRRSSLGAAARLARARAPVGGVHGALGHHLRGVRGQPRDLPGRLLPVRRVRRPDRLPRPAPAHAPDDLRSARAGPRRAAVLGPPAARRRRPDPVRHAVALPPGGAAAVERHGPVAAVVGGRVRPGHARPGGVRPAGAVPRRAAGRRSGAT